MFPVLISLLLGGVPVAFALMGTALLFGWSTFGDRQTVLYLFSAKIDEVASNYVLASVPLFVFMGSLLERSGIARRLIEATHLWTYRLPGGLALSTITMCVIFAASTGVIGATEIVVGLLTIPMMMTHQYSKSLISGTICAGGSLGTIIPPSVVVVILGPTANVSVADLFLAIVAPGAVLAVLYLIYIFVRCVVRPADGPRLPPGTFDIGFRRKMAVTAVALVPPVLMITAVLGSIVFGFAAPTEAAALGALGAFVLAMCYRSLNLRVFMDALQNTLKLTCMIMLILLGGSMFTTVFIATGGTEITVSLIDKLAFGPWGTLILLLGICFVAGMFLDWISIILLFVPLFIPIAHRFGFDTIWFCVLFLLIIQTSYLTPPMAPAIFYLRGIAPAQIKLSDMFRGVVPFILIQLIALLLVVLFPDLATWLPEKLLGFRT